MRRGRDFTFSQDKINKSTRIAKQMDKHRMRTAETQAGRQVTKRITVTQAVFFPFYVKAEIFITVYSVLLVVLL